MGSVQFLDENGSPLLAGIDVSISPGVLTGTTDSNGTISATLATGTLYTASFTGTNAPTQTPSFYGNTQSGSYLTDDSGNILTDDSGNQLLVDNANAPTIVTVAGYVNVSRMRVSQAVVELAVQASPKLRVSQAVVELAVRINPPPKLRVTQTVVEIAVAVFPPTLRVSQAVVEIAVPTIYSVKVFPQNAKTVVGVAVQYMALKLDQNGRQKATTFTWSVDPPSAGSIDQTGLYTPSTEGTHTIIATDNAAS